MTSVPHSCSRATPRAVARPPADHDPLVRSIAVIRYCAAPGAPPPSSELDLVAREAPLQIEVDGQPLAVVMRTPGTTSISCAACC